MAPESRQISEPAYLYAPPSWFEPIPWNSVFKTAGAGESQSARSIHIDVGAGDGGFVKARAKNHPETDFIAIERLLGRARKIARQSEREQIQNLRVLRIEAAFALEVLFGEASVDSITVLFPDPWPKRRHKPNRLIQTPFLDLCARCLKPNGWIAVKTDDLPYFEQVEKVFNSHSAFQSLNIGADDLLPERTDFEKDFIKAGKPIYFMARMRC
jgi:tRNA (guanine-N7-)-methyltransferase